MLAGSESVNPLGSIWSESECLETVSLHAGVGVNHDLPEEIRFLANVTTLVRQRNAIVQAKNDATDEGLAVFLLAITPAKCFDGAMRVPMVDNGRTKLVDRVWFMAAPAISGHYVNLPASYSDADLFDIVSLQLGWGHVPAVVLDSRHPGPQLRFYPAGLDESDRVRVTPIDGDVASADVRDAINDVYSESLVTPSAAPPSLKLWNDAAKHYPSRDAEHQIQAQLKATLIGRFPYCKIRHEQPQSSGRTDLEIEAPNVLDRSTVTRFAILELKVLRSFTSGGNSVSSTRTDAHIESGVEQAHRYCEDKEAKWSAVCCFDMRNTTVSDLDCFDHVLAIANQKQVRLWRWKIYPSAAAYRSQS